MDLQFFQTGGVVNLPPNRTFECALYVHPDTTGQVASGSLVLKSKAARGVKT